jgi:5-methylcytosine-specific restriction endonuclease McrA
VIWTAETYRLYLRSEHWATTRDTALKAASYRCARCGAVRSRSVRLNVHHRTYERLGAEQPGDLEVLCRTCHEGEHGIPPARVVNNWEHISHVLYRVMRGIGFRYVGDRD